MDITNKNDTATFPYYKFNKYTLNNVCAMYKEIEIMDVFANKKCINNKYGVNIFMFIKCDISKDINHIIVHTKDKLQYISHNLECTVVKKQYGKRIFNDIKHPFYSFNKGRGPLAGLMLKGNHSYNNRKYWCCILVDQHKINEFIKFKKPPSISLNELSQYGHIILSKQRFHADDPGFRRSFTFGEYQIYRKLDDYFEFTFRKIWQEFGMKL